MVVEWGVSCDGGCMFRGADGVTCAFCDGSDVYLSDGVVGCVLW